MTAEQERVVEENMPLVHHIVGRLTERFPSAFSRDDLIQAGALGLVEATTKFDPSRGFALSTYAGRRIEGAILDMMRSADWASRSVRQGERQLLAATAELSASLGRQPTEAELMQTMGVERETLDRLRADLSQARLASLDSRAESNGHLGPVAATSAGSDQGRWLEQNELRGYLRDAIRQLPERYQLVIVGYFLEGRTMTELGHLLGVTQSRASQIKGEALAMMREGLNAALDQQPTDSQQVSPTQGDYNRSLQSASAWRDRLVP